MIAEFKQRYRDLRGLPLTFELGGVRGRVLGLGVHYPKWWRNFLHSHSYYEVCFVYQGVGTFRNQGVEHAIAQNDLFLARPDELHEIVANEENPLGIYYWSFTLELSESHSAESINPNTPLAHLVKAFVHGDLISVQAAQLEPLFSLISAELNHLPTGYLSALQALILKLQIDTFRAFAGSAHDMPGDEQHIFDPNAAVVNDVRRFLLDNYSRPLRVRDVAAQVHLSERHANRVVKQVTGRSIMQHLTDIRLAQAKRLLLKPTLSITDVALRVGFEDIRYFSTAFKKHVGESPSTYRQQRGTLFMKQRS